MLRHECVELVREIRPVFKEAGYDLRVGDQIGESVQIYITDVVAETEDSEPVTIKSKMIRLRDSHAMLILLAAHCPFMGLMRADHLTGQLRIPYRPVAHR